MTELQETEKCGTPFEALTIVVPAYNESERIAATLRTVAEYAKTHIREWEIIVVDDGSHDSTSDVAQQALLGDSRLKIIRHEVNKGKGAAIRTGALAASYPYVLFSDADLSTPIEELSLLAPYASPRSVVIASRGLPHSKLEVRQPFYREGMGRIFNLLVRALLLPDIHDTQCGFKLFGAEVAKAVFPLMEVTGFAFDVEVLARAHLMGFRIVEVPVRWRNDKRTKVHAIRDSAKMLRDLLRTWWRLRVWQKNRHTGDIPQDQAKLQQDRTMLRERGPW